MQRKVTTMLFIAVIVALVLSSGYPSLAQASGMQTPKRLRSSDRPGVFDDAQWSPDDDMQMLKRDLKSQKKQIVAANMNLTDPEAEKFWPVYDRYAADLANIYDTKLALVEEYVMQLRLKYVPEFRKVLSGRETALFFQIEWRLDLMINLQLAQAPMIDQ